MHILGVCKGVQRVCRGVHCIKMVHLCHKESIGLIRYKRQFKPFFKPKLAKISSVSVNVRPNVRSFTLTLKKVHSHT